MLLYRAGHPNIVQIHAVHETANGIYMVQELCTGRTLLDVIRKHAPLGEAHAAALFRGVVKSVLHCHQVHEGDAQAERWRHG